MKAKRKSARCATTDSRVGWNQRAPRHARPIRFSSRRSTNCTSAPAHRVRDLKRQGVASAYLYGVEGVDGSPGTTGGIGDLHAFFLLTDQTGGVQPARCADAAVHAGAPRFVARHGHHGWHCRRGCSVVLGWRQAWLKTHDAVRSPFGRRPGHGATGETPPTYYGQRALKPTDWRWLIITYFFVGGLAGAAQVIACIVDLIGHRRDRPLVSAARYIALIGALISPVLLITDLKTPSRFYNMLRIYPRHVTDEHWLVDAQRLRSDDRVGGVRTAGRGSPRLASRTCAGALDGRTRGGFGRAHGDVYRGAALSHQHTAVGCRLSHPAGAVRGFGDRHGHRRVVPGAAPGAWGTVERAPPGTSALVASMIELVLSRRLDAALQHEHVEAPLTEPPLDLPYRLGALGCGVLAPLSVHLLQLAFRRELAAASTLASLAALAGGYTQRAVFVLAGRRSAERPTDYFGLAQRDRVADSRYSRR